MQKKPEAEKHARAISAIQLTSPVLGDHGWEVQQVGQPVDEAGADKEVLDGPPPLPAGLLLVLAVRAIQVRRRQLRRAVVVVVAHQNPIRTPQVRLHSGTSHGRRQSLRRKTRSDDDTCRLFILNVQGST